MRERPNDAILSREDAIEAVKSRFAPQIELLRDIANYGSNLIIRAYNSSPKQMAEAIVCGVLLKQIVAMVDAIEVLLSSGCGHAAFLQARSAFEASIYLDWILTTDSERRATRYLVGNYRDERLWANRVIPGTHEEATFTNITKFVGLDTDAILPSLAAYASHRLAEINRILAQPHLKQIDDEFNTQKAKKKRKHDPKWYELDGNITIRGMASSVGRLAEYEVFYAKGSRVNHCASYKDHVAFSDGHLRFKPIRNLADVNMLLNFVRAISIRTYGKVIETYRPGELEAFRKKYREDWQDPIQSIMEAE